MCMHQLWMQWWCWATPYCESAEELCSVCLEHAAPLTPQSSQKGHNRGTSLEPTEDAATLPPVTMATAIPETWVEWLAHIRYSMYWITSQDAARLFFSHCLDKNNNGNMNNNNERKNPGRWSVSLCQIFCYRDLQETCTHTTQHAAGLQTGPLKSRSRIVFIQQESRCEQRGYCHLRNLMQHGDQYGEHIHTHAWWSASPSSSIATSPP